MTPEEVEQVADLLADKVASRLADRQAKVADQIVRCLDAPVLSEKQVSSLKSPIDEAIRAARLEALEEAAKIIEDAEYEPQSVYSAIRQAAAAIRERAKA